MKKPDNIKDGKRVAVMHGEIWLVPIESMPAGERQTCTSYVAGHSETGHHHVLKSETPFDVVEGEKRAVLLHDVAKIFHQKTHDIHETLYLAPGANEIRHKQEYNPWTKIMQRVFD